MQFSDRKLLVLDLDETLVYAAEEELERAADFTVGQYFVYRRPFLKEFLEFCFENFEVAVWTASTRSYAEIVVENIFDSKQQISFVWARERCTVCFDMDERDYYFEKKMRKIRRLGYALDSVIVVDNTPKKWRASYGNLVHVRSFFGDTKDDELQHLIGYLEKLKKIENIRRLEKRNWRNRL